MWAGCLLLAGCSVGTAAKCQACCLPSPPHHAPSSQLAKERSEQQSPRCFTGSLHLLGAGQLAERCGSWCICSSTSASTSFRCIWASACSLCSKRRNVGACKCCTVSFSWLTDFTHSFRENKMAFCDLDVALQRGFQNPLLAVS